MPGDWASGANPSDLDALAQAVEDGRLAMDGGSAAALQSLGLAEPAMVRAFLRSVPTGEPRALAWFLRRLASERRASADRLAGSAQLVWSGHSEGHQPLRDTRTVLAEVCARATHHVLLATYVVYDGGASLAALARRMREVPALRVDFYVDVKAPKKEPVDEPRHTSAWLEAFRATHWPADVRAPAVWYDPAALDPYGGTSLHAKCLVVDERWCFVTSANFTEAAQERNIEVGVLLDQPALAQTVVGQFQGLRERGWFRRIEGT